MERNLFASPLADHILQPPCSNQTTTMNDYGRKSERKENVFGSTYFVKMDRPSIHKIHHGTEAGIESIPAVEDKPLLRQRSETYYP
ncbi:hypothetical protein KIN20_010288 [Parelaphostrongylus tenuis]|uniref:Uncharacterized protein n=1 Tax=Parelaphostrongylus tenuis TaxID=148309 RepID=A0AAD5M7N5_PARTN|nr:hypothetical protein KIN20_010288 [Parelaphostrongylus tenuis]